MLASVDAQTELLADLGGQRVLYGEGPNSEIMPYLGQKPFVDFGPLSLRPFVESLPIRYMAGIQAAYPLRHQVDNDGSLRFTPIPAIEEIFGHQPYEEAMAVCDKLGAIITPALVDHRLVSAQIEIEDEVENGLGGNVTAHVDNRPNVQNIVGITAWPRNVMFLTGKFVAVGTVEDVIHTGGNVVAHHLVNTQETDWETVQEHLLFFSYSGSIHKKSAGTYEHPRPVPRRALLRLDFERRAPTTLPQ